MEDIPLQVWLHRPCPGGKAQGRLCGQIVLEAVIEKRETISEICSQNRADKIFSLSSREIHGLNALLHEAHRGLKPSR